MTHKPTFEAADLARLDVSSDETPDSRPVAETFAVLQEEVVTKFRGSEWGQRYIWQDRFESPYIGPNNSTESRYVWLGLVDEYYDDLPRASRALQLEFGVDAGTTTGFFDQEVIWGILLGPWAKDEVIETARSRLREHSSLFATFLTDNDYVLLTENARLDTPDEDQIEEIIEDVEQGFALTRTFEMTDLPRIDVLRAACETISQLTPLYRLLSGINDAPPVSSEQRLTKDTSQTSPPALGWDIDSLAAATTLDTADIEDAVNRLTSEGCSENEAIGYVRRYLMDMLRGEGLFAVYGVGPSSGHALVEAGITTIEELRAATPQALSERTDLPLKRVRRILDAANREVYSSLDPDDEQVANRLLNSPEKSSIVDSPDDGPATTDQYTHSTNTESNVTSSTKSLDSDKPVATKDDTEHDVLAPDELPVPPRETVTVPGGGTVFSNYLSEYYESIRSARTVLEHVFQMPGTDIDPENLRDPRVQYFVLLDACLGFGDVATPFTGYGPQHQDRLPFSIWDYRKVFGDAHVVTDYQVIAVEPFSDETHELLREQAGVKPTREFVKPCVPGTDIPILELPGDFTALKEAALRLATFPAYPPLPTENGSNKRTIPVAEIYQTCFGDLDPEHRADLTPSSMANESPPTGPVTAATPTSSTEAESKLLDYGRLSHLFRRVTPPTESPANRILNVFALDWYRSSSSSFEDLQALAKHGEDEPVDVFRPRLQDLLHRRFLLDTWDYDYITVFPGHEAGSLSPQLVQLAQDAVLETNIIYTPLLERTETVQRQREKAEEERWKTAITPSESLRARAKLNSDTVLLLDDICTTGSSLIAGTHLLRQAGADRVVCLTLGLTPGGPSGDVTEITDPEATASEIIAGVNR